MKLNRLPNRIRSRQMAGRGPGIVVNGHLNLVSGAEAEARRIVEAKYAAEWNSLGWIHRWKLQRVMDSEIKELVNASMDKISSHAVF